MCLTMAPRRGSGWRRGTRSLATWHPERVAAVISQNGNAYAEGLSDGWKPIRAYWENSSQTNRDALRAFLAPETTVWQYTHGVPDTTTVSPDGYSLRPQSTKVQFVLDSPLEEAGF